MKKPRINLNNIASFAVLVLLLIVLSILSLIQSNTKQNIELNIYKICVIMITVKFCSKK